ncbi:MAG: DUF58 domain-containing protein [Bacilli bacterium]|nr:DUF58 domain-containing protein [Bacilli bacterium]
MKKSYINRIKNNVSIFSKKYSKNILDGNYRSVYKGKSLNFDDLREYVVGDNVRDIDWKASARSRKFLIKQYIAEKKHNIIIIMDADKKMLAESKDGDEKKDISLMTAGTIAYLAIKNGDEVGSIYNLNNKIEYFPFKNSFYHLELALARYDLDTNINSTSNINDTINFLRNHIQKNLIVFIITDIDGLNRIDQKYIKELSMRHDLMIITISDGFIYGDETYDIDSNEYIPLFISKNKELLKLEEKIHQDVYSTFVNKSSGYKIGMTVINSNAEIPMKIIYLLESYKYANRI